MRCEFEYIINKDIESLKRTTKLEILIILAFSVCACVSLVLSVWLYAVVLMIPVIFGLVGYYLSFKDAIKYCKNKKE